MSTLNMDDTYINSLNVYRLKIFGIDQLNYVGYRLASNGEFNVGEGLGYPYWLYLLIQGEARIPKWFEVFLPLLENLSPDSILALTPKFLNPGFILIVKINESYYAVCGGVAHNVIRKNPIDQKFGLLIAQKILSIPDPFFQR